MATTARSTYHRGITVASQEIQKHQGRSDSWFANQGDTNHQKEHVGEVIQCQVVQHITGWQQLDDRCDKLITDEIVIDFEQNAHDCKNKNILRRPARHKTGCSTAPKYEEE
jgi:hypothetical protein